MEHPNGQASFVFRLPGLISLLCLGGGATWCPLTFFSWDAGIPEVGKKNGSVFRLRIIQLVLVDGGPKRDPF